jgi:hypothetical protein
MLPQLLVRCGVLLPLMPPVVDVPPEAASTTRMEISFVAAVPRESSEPPACPASCSMADEIVQLRRTLLMSPLAGSTLEPSSVGTQSDDGRLSTVPAEQFEQLLRQLLQTRPDETPLQQALEWLETDEIGPPNGCPGCGMAAAISPSPPSLRALSASETNRVPPLPPFAGSPGGSLVDDEQMSLSAYLRTVSRQMDQLANDLEDRHEYTKADELRELSQQLRHRTRRID